MQTEAVLLGCLPIALLDYANKKPGPLETQCSADNPSPRACPRFAAGGACEALISRNGHCNFTEPVYRGENLLARILLSWLSRVRTQCAPRWR